MTLEYNHGFNTTPSSSEEDEYEHLFEDQIPTRRYVVDPRISFEGYEEYQAWSDDYLGERYLHWKDQIARLRQLGAPEIIINNSRTHLESGLDKARAQLEKASGNKYVIDLVEKYPVPENILEKISGPDGESKVSLLARASDEALAEFLEWNRDYIDSMAESKQKLIEKYAAEFYERISKAVNKKGLPISRKQLQERLAQLPVIRFSDPIAMTLAEKDGDYDARFSKIRVAVIEDEDHIRRIIFHELLHHFSGQTRVAEIDYFSSDHIESRLRSRRTGFSIRHLNDLERKDSRKWLNEATTEQLAQVLLSEQGEQIDFRNIGLDEFFSEPFSGGVYKKERSVLKQFVKFMENEVLATF